MDLIPKNAVTLTAVLRPLSEQEVTAFGGYNFAGRITADDLTQAALNTVQDINIATFLAEAVLQQLEIRLVTPFQNTADTGFNTTTVTLKDDNASPETIISAKELNANGSFITAPAFATQAYGPYAAGKHLIAEFGSQSGKKLSDINRGELHIFAQIVVAKKLSDLTPKALISKP